MDDSSIFSGNDRKEKEQQMLRDGRLPPGQSLTLKWPVLHYGSVPRFDPARWDFRIRGLVEQPVRLHGRNSISFPRLRRTAIFTASRAGVALTTTGKALHFKTF